MKRITASVCIFALLAVCLMFASCTKETMGGHPVGKLELTNDAVEYRFYYPDTWQVQMNDGMTCIYVSSNDPSNVSVTKFGLGTDFATLDDYISGQEHSFTSEWNAVFGQTDFGTPADIKLGELDAKQLVYDVTINNVQYRYMQVFALHEGDVYTLTYAARAEMYDLHLEDVNDIIASFSFK